ncbi:MAG: cytidylate kinase [Ignavibacteria bacterium]|nr:MAG: cytidylate kinase [Ignavibacteria bacterium]KAF0160454.1 MAG: cytidylate kinase [Ignavibacteria bacterium]
MKNITAYEKARYYIERNTEEDFRTQKRKQNPGPVITVSRETGIGAGVICQKLTEYFNSRAIELYDDWTYFDKSLIERVMQDYNMPDHFKKTLSDEKPSNMDAWLSEILGISPSRLSLLYKTSNTIKRLADFGNVIFVGRGANIITAKYENAFHIRLVAPINYRIETSMDLYQLDKRTAAEFVKHEDEARKLYVLKYFHKNIEDPLLYHIIINTYLLSFDEIAVMIGQSVVKRFQRYFRSRFATAAEN